MYTSRCPQEPLEFRAEPNRTEPFPYCIYIYIYVYIYIYTYICRFRCESFYLGGSTYLALLVYCGLVCSMCVLLCQGPPSFATLFATVEQPMR